MSALFSSARRSFSVLQLVKASLKFSNFVRVPLLQLPHPFFDTAEVRWVARDDTVPTLELFYARKKAKSTIVTLSW